MKSLRNPREKEELLLRLERIQPSSERLWGAMSAHQMICHLADGYRLYMGEIKAPLHPTAGSSMDNTRNWFVGAYALAPRKNPNVA
jgi:hypothetical protein